MMLPMRCEVRPIGEVVTKRKRAKVLDNGNVDGTYHVHEQNGEQTAALDVAIA